MPWVPATNGNGAAPLHLTAFSRIAHPIHPKAEACYLSDSQQRSKDSLTNQPVNGSDARAVHSSGGAAGGVVSEGQGYGCLDAPKRVVDPAAVLAGLVDQRPLCDL